MGGIANAKYLDRLPATLLGNLLERVDFLDASPRTKEEVYALCLCEELKQRLAPEGVCQWQQVGNF